MVPELQVMKPKKLGVYPLKFRLCIDPIYMVIVGWHVKQHGMTMGGLEF